MSLNQRSCQISKTTDISQYLQNLVVKSESLSKMTLLKKSMMTMTLIIVRRRRKGASIFLSQTTRYMSSRKSLPYQS